MKKEDDERIEVLEEEVKQVAARCKELVRGREEASQASLDCVPHGTVGVAFFFFFSPSEEKFFWPARLSSGEDPSVHWLP